MNTRERSLVATDGRYPLLSLFQGWTSASILTFPRNLYHGQYGVLTAQGSFPGVDIAGVNLQLAG